MSTPPPAPLLALLESAFFHLPDTLLMVIDGSGQIEVASEGWNQQINTPVDSLRGRRLITCLHPDDHDRVREHLRGLTHEHSTARFLARWHPDPDTVRDLHWSLRLDSTSGRIFVSAHQPSAPTCDPGAPLPEAFTDNLTGLPNRRLFLDRLQHTIQRAQRRDLQHAVLYCGIDRFKVVNHSLGHRLGDLLLIAVANLLKASIRPTDMVARLGGDEFALLLEDIRDPTSPLRVVNRIQEMLVMPFPLHEHEVCATVSFGIVISEQEYSHPDPMIRDASMAMMRAKSLGGGSYVVFNKDMHDAAVRRLQTEMDLRRALERAQFQTFYQPIMDLRNGRLSGFEALVRWRHPEKGLIPPAEFIPIAEETGLILSLGQWVMEQAARQLKDWQRRFPRRPLLTVSVNVSARQLMQPNLVHEVRRVLRETGLNPASLKLEITESAMMENAEQALAVLEALRATGIKLMLDDFGTGYSSLSYLHRLPVDTLKIDRSFVMHMHENATDCSFVETIVSLAHKLGRSVVCEGVELQAQADLLSTLGVEYSQGYLHSRPVAAHEAEMLVIDDVAQRTAHHAASNPQPD